MRKALFLYVISVLVFTLAGCGGKPAPERLAAKGKNTVCILSGEKRFKNEVIAKVTTSLEAKGYKVVRDETAHSEYYRAADYGAVVYIAEYWAWHTPRHAIRYFNGNGKSPSIVFMITSGDPDVTIKQPFDAVTSASSPKNVDTAAGEILARLEGILK
ncbi:MAG: hypothetical protein ACYC9O_13895 [Candidatus Latescibacterota bacterium]